MFLFHCCLEERTRRQKQKLLERKSVYILHSARGHLIIDPWQLSDNSTEATSPRSFTFLYLLSSHTQWQNIKPHQPHYLIPPCSHLSLGHLGCCPLFGWAELWFFVTSLLNGYCPSFSGTYPVKDPPGWNYLVFLGVSLVCWRYTCYPLFVFLLFKV